MANSISNAITAFVNLIKTFSFADAIDIIIIAFLIYSAIKLIRETRAEQLVKGLIVLIIVWAISFQLNLKMVNTLLNNFFQFTVLAIFVLFQPEIRRALEQLGRAKFKRYWNGLPIYSSEELEKKFKNCLNAVANACESFSKSKTGALIVFEKNTKIGEIIDTGTIIDATATKQLIANIFYNKAPLHDGAMVIRNSMIHAAGCILPLTKNSSLSAELGTRHRAAVGITEISDAIVVVVSEESGTISIVKNGTITRNFSKESLYKALEKYLFEENNTQKKKSMPFFIERMVKREK